MISARLSIANGGIDDVTTGGFLDDLVTMLEAAKADIANGSIVLEARGTNDVRHIVDLVAS